MVSSNRSSVLWNVPLLFDLMWISPVSPEWKTKPIIEMKYSYGWYIHDLIVLPTTTVAGRKRPHKEWSPAAPLGPQMASV